MLDGHSLRRAMRAAAEMHADIGRQGLHRFSLAAVDYADTGRR